MDLPLLADAINNGTWYECESVEYLDERLRFCVRFRGFEPFDREQVDEIEGVTLDQGDLFILKVDVVNLGKKPQHPYFVLLSILLVDQDECEFEAVGEYEIIGCSKIANELGLSRFADASDVPNLRPKTQASGALLYLLPDEPGVKYAIQIKDGTIQPV